MTSVARQTPLGLVVWRTRGGFISLALALPP